MPIFFAIVGLIFIIMIHEGGHFLAARLVGVRVTKFYLFFPPKLFAVRRGDVEYGVGSIPLGGFVKLPGMFEPVPKEVAWRLEPSMDTLMAAIVDSEAQMRVSAAYQQMSRASSPDELSLAAGDLRRELLELGEHGINDEMQSDDRQGPRPSRILSRVITQLEATVEDCHPQAYWRAELWKRMTVICAGPLANIVLAFVVLWIVAMALTPVYHYDWSIASVVKKSPAQDAGVKAGDRIIAWQGVKPGSSSSDAERFSKHIKTTLGKPVTLKLRGKDGTVRTVRISPESIKGDQRIGVVSRIEERFVRYTGDDPAGAFVNAGGDMYRTSTGVLTGLSRLVNPDNLDEVSSVVGIVRVAPQWAKAGALVPYLAILSLAIAIYNLIPLLPMDGGHIAFGIIERLRRGRALPRAAFERYSFVGLALMLGLFMIGLRNDLGL